MITNRQLPKVTAGSKLPGKSSNEQRTRQSNQPTRLSVRELVVLFTTGVYDDRGGAFGCHAACLLTVREHMGRASPRGALARNRGINQEVSAVANFSI